MTIQIPVFKAEASIADKIRESTSVAYVTEVKPWEPSDKAKEALLKSIDKAKASSFKDLYPTQSVLVTTNWNKNDDVFGPLQTWAARKTPVNKPTNLDHNENVLVGHITDNWVIDAEGNIISDDTPVDELPDVFHLCNGAVIYTHWENPELVERTKALIEQIENGTKYVSMECVFTNFGYAVVTPNGESKIVARTQDTAFLTKHLRAYGGTGQYNGYKVGRFLENITFTGKGYVDRPANPDSIIFSKGSTVAFSFSKAEEENTFLQNSGVCSNSERFIESDAESHKENELMANDINEVLQKQLDDLRAELAQAKQENKELAQKTSESSVALYEAQIKELTEELAEAKKYMEEDKKKKDEMKSKSDESDAKIEELNNTIAELQKQIDEAKAEQVKAERISTLVDGGVEKADAEVKVEKFAALNDEQFEVVAAALIEAAKARDIPSEGTQGTEETEEEDSDQDDAEANADADLEDAEAEDEVTPSVQPDDDKAEALKSLAKSISSYLKGSVQIDDDSE